MEHHWLSSSMVDCAFKKFMTLVISPEAPMKLLPLSDNTLSGLPYNAVNLLREERKTTVLKSSNKSKNTARVTK